MGARKHRRRFRRLEVIDLARFFRELRPLVVDSEPTIEDLRFLIRKPGRNNDLIELTAKMPRLAALASDVFPRSVRTLQKAQPVLEYIRPYTPDFMGWLTKFGQGAAAYDANGHYARIQPLFNAFQYTETPLGPVLNAVPPGERSLGLEVRKTQRCPGGAMQRPPDGSAPWRGDDGTLECDPSTVPPG
jgi:phospholipid/cholesterol/gamma-HCH transport system substrate-binding protein